MQFRHHHPLREAPAHPGAAARALAAQAKAVRQVQVPHPRVHQVAHPRAAAHHQVLRVRAAAHHLHRVADHRAPRPLRAQEAAPLALPQAA